LLKNDDGDVDAYFLSYIPHFHDILFQIQVVLIVVVLLPEELLLAFVFGKEINLLNSIRRFE
jgi:hypothetical protein